jgi:uncharacterized glyoxalase superfamily protein PhnB
MPAKVKPIPDGYHALTPYISIKGASDAIAFYKKAFGAEELLRMPMPDGRVGHAELQFGDSRLMLADEMPEVPDAIAKSPHTLGGVTSGLNFYVADVDAVVKRAVDGREGAAPAHEPVLRRPQRHAGGSVRSAVDGIQPRRGRLARGDGAADGGHAPNGLKNGRFAPARRDLA